ncbi:hypothetical protein PoB_006597600 [Plakobranchus ocellatus]|uniref:Uncharacterized protein n=1 Tax=Plakobranchus ocellatus TaxID=259542 RepID=A0AAV4D5X5_9GAST|nr:hypothetical protein PoB_006597600 [Plakobranchus ocellatus]
MATFCAESSEDEDKLPDKITVIDLSFGMDARNLDIFLWKNMKICPLSPERKDLSVASPSSFELITVKLLDSPRMDNRQR